MLKLLLSAVLSLGLALSNINTPSPHNTEIKRSPDSFSVPVPLKERGEDPRLKGIRLIGCTNGKKAWLGSMVHVGHLHYLTVHHVAGEGVCYDVETGTKLDLVHDEPSNDFAILASPKDLDTVIFPISCQPMTTNETYHSIGWAGGQVLMGIDLKATASYTDQFFIVEGAADKHMRILKGIIVGGMSGGPVLDDNWVIHGMNNATFERKNRSYSRELKDTALCK